MNHIHDIVEEALLRHPYMLSHNDGPKDAAQESALYDRSLAVFHCLRFVLLLLENCKAKGSIESITVHTWAHSTHSTQWHAHRGTPFC